MLQVLQSVPLRSWANQMAYYDKEKLATDDAMRIGRLHTFLPGRASPWLCAIVYQRLSSVVCQQSDVLP